MAFVVEGLSVARDINEQVRRIGEYQSLEDAIAAAKQVINDFLASESRPGMPFKRLFARYQYYGEVPYIFRDDDSETVNVPEFNHFQYALALCADMSVKG